MIRTLSRSVFQCHTLCCGELEIKLSELKSKDQQFLHPGNK